ncbi:hypothetical protein B0T19DRAFT_403077 [Cercophora scortea]|uniref:Secreted protein n=1 Tax=Cercophora scortea TaxID=314031 RepID=A0AAE0I999_9PEZI|nr:hypothetical protein B0T19DRAFT_403077 [Cercophora scortea]
MCRMIAFVGCCTTCAGIFTWPELSQELSCLEAKNVGVFGQCSRGVQTDQHPYDQECDACAAEAQADEGYGGMVDDQLLDWSGAGAAGGKLHPFVDEDTSAAGTQTTTKKKLAVEGRKAMADGDEDGRRSKKQRTS